MDRISNLSKMSFIQARDPSLIAWSRCAFKSRTNLEHVIEQEGDSTVVEEDNNIQVYLRIKNVPYENLYEISDNFLICNLPEGSHSMRNAKEGDCVTKKYSFSQIFGPESTQQHIFNCIVKPKLLSFINGRNNTLLTYGASGSGKTFTVVGTDKQPGLIPRALEYLFRSVPELSKSPVVKPLPDGQVIKLDETEQRYEVLVRDNLLNSSLNLSSKAMHSKIYRRMQERLSGEPSAMINSSQHLSVAVWVSFAEIYNEHIYDLLVAGPPRGKSRTNLRLGSSGSETYIRNLTNVNVTSGEEAYQILQYGLHNLNVAATSINSHSSRSHCIFTIKLVQITKADDCVQINHFNFCDLAGAERLKKTNNIGDRLKESNNINTSLLVLGKCISIVRNAQKNGTSKVVPFRESKLTQLFQKALLGNEHISMIVNMNPALDMFDESQHVLNFSAIAKDIIVESQKPPVCTSKNNRFSAYMQNEFKKHDDSEKLQSYKDTIDRLLEELETQKVEMATNEEMNTKRIIANYESILEKKDDLWKTRLVNQEKKLRREFKNKMDSIKLSHEYEINANNKRAKVICLDSSDEDDENIEELKEELQSVNQKLHECKNDNKQLMVELENTEKKYSQAKRKIFDLNNTITELQSTLEDAKQSYLELESTMEDTTNKLKSENFALKEREQELEQSLLLTQATLAIKNRILEELEEKRLKEFNSNLINSTELNNDDDDDDDDDDGISFTEKQTENISAQQ